MRRFSALRAEFEATTGHRLVVVTTYRSPAEQRRLYNQGRTTPGRIVTECDGHVKLCKHNRIPVRALDVRVVVSGQGTDDPRHYAPLGPLAEKHGLTWGGHWKRLRDYPHLELPGWP